MFFRPYVHYKKSKSESESKHAGLNISFDDRLPFEVFCEILSYLAPEDIRKLTSINSYFDEAVSNLPLWKHLVAKNSLETSNYYNIFIQHYKFLFGSYKFSYQKRFLSAAFRGDLKEAEILFLKHKKMEQLVIDDALLFAAINGQMAMVDYLLNTCKANINAIYRGKWEKFLGLTALHCAAVIGNLEMFKHLIIHGADINLHAKNKHVLDFVSIYGHKAILEYVITLIPGDKLKAFLNAGLWTPLHYAAHNNHLELVKLLVENGANQNTRVDYQDDKLTAFLLAAEAGHIEVVKFFLEQKTDINFGAGNCTALHLASNKNHLKLFGFLAENGANMLSENRIGNTPLHIAAVLGHLEIIKIYAEKKIDLNIKENCIFGATPLYKAALYSKPKVVEFLLERLPAIKWNDYKAYWGDDFFANSEKREICILFRCEKMIRETEAAIQLTNYNPSLLEEGFSKCLTIHPQYFYQHVTRVQNKEEFRPYTDMQRMIFLGLEVVKKIIENKGIVEDKKEETTNILTIS